MLKILNRMDKQLLTLQAHQLSQALPEPTLFHLKGEQEPALFVSVLLHGNENSGWEVVKRIMENYQGKKLPRSMSVFIGNVKAARYKKRKLQTQPDFNRVWSAGDSEEHRMMASIVDIMKERGVFASVDIHNNNGLNPHYACINRLDKTFLTMAREFSRMVIYFVRPSGVQSLAFSKLCPSVTLECGQPGDEYGIQLTTNFVDKLLNMERLRAKPEIAKSIDLYHTVGVVKVPDEVTLSFNNEDADIQFVHGVERLNFEEIPLNTIIGKLNGNMERPLIVLDEDGQDVFDNYFTIEEDALHTATKIMPAMLTDKINIIRQDCLCYLMEQYDVSMGEKKTKTDEPVWR